MRILSLHPATTELLFALGASGNLVGRTDSCNYPEGAQKIPSIGKPEETTPEMIAVFEPDLVMLGEGQEDLAEQLGKSFNVSLFTPNSIEDLLREMMALAELMGKQLEADVLIHELMRVFERVQEKTKRFHTVRAYFEVSHNPPKTADGYIKELITLAGGTPFTGEATPERLKEFDPQVIVVSEKEFDFELLLARYGYQDLSAVRYERLFALDGELFHRPGPRLALGAKTLAKILHGVSVNGA